MLGAADPPVVAIGGFEEFVSAIPGVLRDSGAQAIHLGDGHRRKAARDVEVLLENLRRIDTADERSNRQAQHIPDRFLRCHDPLLKSAGNT